MEEAGLFDGNDDGTFVPFTDILFNVVMGFSFMIFIAFALIKPETKHAIELKAEMLIDANWPDGSQADIDLYVQDPEGNVVWYNRREAGFLNLERDDRGMYRDTMVVGGKRVENPLNQETVTMRRFVQGTYTVNVVNYNDPDNTPVPVTVTVTKVNPELKIVYTGTVTLAAKDEEQTVVRFTLDKDGVIQNVDTRGGFTSLVRATRQPAVTPPANPGSPAAAPAAQPGGG
jgi:hypothetical protein